jgi:polyisoprenoid-binding protein YceI
MILKKTAIFSVLRLLLPLALIPCVDSAAGQLSLIDTAHSKLLVHVSKSGVFSGFADNHEVEARIAEGSLDTKAGQLRLSVDSRQMHVLDPQLSSDKRQQVQERMLGPEVLDSIRFPEITFESTHVEQEHEGRIRVDGLLSLHGVTKPVSVLAQVEHGRYTGRLALRQRDFGITPVSIAGGTVKVKDELTIEFDIHTAPGEKGK